MFQIKKRQRFKVNLKVVTSFFVLCLLTTYSAYAAIGMDKIKEEIKKLATQVKETVDPILEILVIIAFVLMVANMVFKTVSNQVAIVSFMVVLALWGVFALLF